MCDIQFEVLKLQNYKIGCQLWALSPADKTIDANLENGFYYLF